MSLQLISDKYMLVTDHIYVGLIMMYHLLALSIETFECIIELQLA